MYSYATIRKIRIIEEKFGSDWKTTHPGLSIDAAYNQVVGDTRKNLFCKIDSSTKGLLDEMIGFHKIGMAEFVEALIEAEWSRHSSRLKETEQRIQTEFSGT